ncbi:MAG: peptidoglycan-binding domain-containing protein [Burkholderiaceae bacterium]
MKRHIFIAASIAALASGQVLAAGATGSGSSTQSMGQGTTMQQQGADGRTTQMQTPGTGSAGVQTPGSGAAGMSTSDSGSIGTAGSGTNTAGMQSSDQMAQNMNPADVRKVQQALKDQGDASIRVDGIWGDNTKQALMNFQRKQNLDPTGELDAQTVAALEVDLDKAGSTTMGSSTDRTGMENRSEQATGASPAAPGRETQKSE